MKKKHIEGNCPSHSQGFTLFELLIAIVLASISILGLAYSQTKSLQYAYSSKQYTLASIQASNTVEQIWGKLCDLQDGDSLSGLKIEDGFTLTPTTFNHDMTLTISWNDSRIGNDGVINNNIEIPVVFPDISDSTTHCP